MPDRYFSESEHGEKPRIVDTIDQRVWEGIRAEIERRLQNGSFAKDFPEECPDVGAIAGTDERGFSQLFVHASLPSKTAFPNKRLQRKRSSIS